MKAFEVKSMIKEELVSRFGKMKGMTNSSPVRIEGKDYPAGSVVFNGFAGRLKIPLKLYVGVVKFTTDSNSPPGKTTDFDEILKSIDLAKAGGQPVKKAASAAPEKTTS